VSIAIHSPWDLESDNADAETSATKRIWVDPQIGSTRRS
jgi:hypothetical protein